jgi:hypothetical protein
MDSFLARILRHTIELWISLIPQQMLHILPPSL